MDLTNLKFEDVCKAAGTPVTSVAKPKFDWSTAKTGMAFQTNVPGWDVVWFMCFYPKPERSVCVTNDKYFGMTDGTTSVWSIDKLARVPEHDIE